MALATGLCSAEKAHEFCMLHGLLGQTAGVGGLYKETALKMLIGSELVYIFKIFLPKSL
jgi:hypothetical protein